MVKLRLLRGLCSQSSTHASVNSVFEECEVQAHHIHPISVICMCKYELPTKKSIKLSRGYVRRHSPPYALHRRAAKACNALTTDFHRCQSVSPLHLQIQSLVCFTFQISLHYRSSLWSERSRLIKQAVRLYIRKRNESGRIAAGPGSTSNESTPTPARQQFKATDTSPGFSAAFPQQFNFFNNIFPTSFST